MQHLTASISKEISPQEAGGWWVLRQLSPALVESIDACKGLEGVLGDFALISANLEELIDDIEETISDGVEADSTQSEPIDASERVNHIELRAWEVCSQLLEQFSKFRMLIVPLVGGDLSSVRERILEIAGSEQGHEVDIILNRLPIEFKNSVFMGELRKVIQNGSSVRLILCRPGVTESAGQDLMNEIDSLIRNLDSNDVVVQVSAMELPSAMILDKTTVAMGWGNWFDSIASTAGQFGFVVDSGEFANQIAEYAQSTFLSLDKYRA